MKYCPQCGRPTKSEHLFCIFCGARFPEYTVTQPHSEPELSSPSDPATSESEPIFVQSAPEIHTTAGKYNISYWLIWAIMAASTALLVTLALIL